MRPWSDTAQTKKCCDAEDLGYLKYPRQYCKKEKVFFLKFPVHFPKMSLLDNKGRKSADWRQILVLFEPQQVCFLTAQKHSKHLQPHKGWRHLLEPLLELWLHQSCGWVRIMQGFAGVAENTAEKVNWENNFLKPGPVFPKCLYLERDACNWSSLIMIK